MRFLKQNSLSIVLFALFALSLAGLSVAGFTHENNERTAHNQPVASYFEYIVSPHFAEAIFENWESEFLQMGLLVVLTIWLRQKGSADSKKLRGKEQVDTSSRYSIIRAANWRMRVRGVGHALYANSLSIALFTLFLVSFAAHALGGMAAANQAAAQHGQPALNIGQYIASPQFWFESFQNWQSEFLAVAALLVLSIYLRQRHSPESKPVGASNAQTGS